jgi:hypothetical protein
MKMFRYIIIVLSGLMLSFLLNNNLQAQSKAKIENIDFSAAGSNLNITYDIVNAKAGESFEVWIKIYTESGKVIIPSAVTGDVGKGVSGGPNKRIVWDVESDNAVLDEEISVEVFARSENKPGTKTEKTKESVLDKEIKSGSNVKVGKAIFLSALLPGLGNRYVNGKGAQWLIGIAGYGMIAGSVALNNSAYNSYEDYKSATTSVERDDYFKKAKGKNSTSKVLAGTAIAIWVVDLVWTGIQAGKAKRRPTKTAFSLTYTYDPVMGKPMIGFNYWF